MKAKLNVKMFKLPNFLQLDVRLVGLTATEMAMDIGLLFPHDEEASAFWDDAKSDWMEHVRKRRAAQSENSEP